MPDADLASNGFGFYQLIRGQAGRDSCYANGSLPKHITGDFQQQAAVRTARIGHRHAVKQAQDILKSGKFF